METFKVISVERDESMPDTTKQPCAVVNGANTIVQLTLEVKHDDKSPDDLAARIAEAASAAINGLAFDDELLADVQMYGTKVLSSTVLS